LRSISSTVIPSRKRDLQASSTRTWNWLGNERAPVNRFTKNSRHSVYLS
jgi:hypothetical protein